METNKLETNNNKYTIDYFINLASSIPDEKWFIGDYMDTNDHSKKCWMGHINYKNGEYDSFTRIALIHNTARPSDINDGKSNIYNQETPKLRILAYLNDIKAKLIEKSLV